MTEEFEDGRDELPADVGDWFAQQREFWRLARANGYQPPHHDEPIG
ncbi:hypothetical protein WKY82_10300 [Gordonia malaquae]